MDIADDREFLAAFERAAIPGEQWTHRDHVRVAFLYLRDLPFDQALERLRRGIQVLNRANGVIDTPTSGYHETITVAWARLTATALARAAQPTDFANFAQRNPRLLDKFRLRDHYSRDLIMSPQARKSFVEPDVAPLPRDEAGRSASEELGGETVTLVVPYDPQWPIHFERLRERLASALGDLALSIEHVGSTSVPGLVAKPIIDIDVVIGEQSLQPTVTGLAALGYRHEGELGIPGRHAFELQPQATNEQLPKHHLYVCFAGSDELNKHLSFREVMRGDPGLVAALSQLKVELCKRFNNDRAAYMRGKASFYRDLVVRDGLAAVAEWKAQHGAFTPAELDAARERVERRASVLAGEARSTLERVVVMGTSGSGKTTFARELASSLGSTHVELDALYWGPNWTPRSEFMADVAGAAMQPRWVADGNYSAARDVLWARATTVVWLDFAFVLTFSRAMIRTVRRMISGETVYAGNRETFRNAFLDFNGIPWWVLRTYRRRRREMPLLMRRPEYQHIEFCVLRSTGEAAAFLNRVRAEVHGSEHGQSAERIR